MLNKIKEYFFNKEFKKLKPKIGIVSEMNYLTGVGFTQRQALAVINVMLKLKEK